MAVVAWIFVALGLALAAGSSLGVLVMRDPYQRLHFLAPIASVSPICFTVALFFGESDKQPALKMLLIALLLNLVNGVVTHATARAHRVRQGQPCGRK